MTGDETEYLQPVLGLLPNQRFKPLKSTWVASLLLFLVIMLEGAGVIMVLFWPQDKLHCEPLYLLIYCHSTLWLIVLMLDHVLKWKHNKIRLEGYLNAYGRFSKYGSMPFYIVSFCSTAMLMMVVGYQQSSLMQEQVCLSREWNSPLTVALAVTSVETTLLAYTLILYLVMVHQFNSAKAPPDVHCPDTWDAFTNQEVGYRERGEDVQDLLQKQADSLIYYQNTVEVLQRKVMELTAHVRGDAIN